MEQLKTYIRRYCSIAEDDLTAVVALFQFRTVRRGSLILQPGQVCGEYIYIESGAFRMFRQQGDHDATAWVFFEDDSFCELPSFLRQIPSAVAVQALEDCRIWSLSHVDMERLYGLVPAWQEFARRQWERTILQFVDMAQTYQTDSAAVRYAKLTADRRLLQRVSGRHLASLLGITPYTLSRLRRKR